MFFSLLRGAQARHPVKVFGFCLMRSHFHFIVEPSHEKALSEFL